LSIATRNVTGYSQYGRYVQWTSSNGLANFHSPLLCNLLVLPVLLTGIVCLPVLRFSNQLSSVVSNTLMRFLMFPLTTVCGIWFIRVSAERLLIFSRFATCSGLIQTPITDPPQSTEPEWLSMLELRSRRKA
jgi:hypothetical protein